MSSKSRQFPVLGILGLVLLTAGVIAIANNAFACTNCNCYFSADCASGQSCSYSSGCRVWSANGKRVDGTCSGGGTNTVFNSTDSPIAAQALDLWLQAYEFAGLRGGDPDESLIEQARALPLSPEQHNLIRHLAIDTEIALFGLAADPDDENGRFILPQSAIGVIDICPVPEPAPLSPLSEIGAANGTLLPLDPASSTVGQIVREAMVAELKNPYHSDFHHIMSRISREAPVFESSGICDGGPRFPFKDTLDCLNQEVLRMVHSTVLPAHELNRPHARPAV
jgi:hypothetical protein